MIARNDGRHWSNTGGVCNGSMPTTMHVCCGLSLLVPFEGCRAPIGQQLARPCLTSNNPGQASQLSKHNDKRTRQTPNTDDTRERLPPAALYLASHHHAGWFRANVAALQGVLRYCLSVDAARSDPVCSSLLSHSCLVLHRRIRGGPDHQTEPRT